MALKIDIKKSLGDFHLDVHLHTTSKRIGILGASGCGKSMTLKCIAGIETPDEGSIVLGERILFDADQKCNPKPQKRNVGYLFQNYALFPNMTVAQNISIGMKASKSVKKAKVEELLAKMNLSGMEDRYPSQLSGGQQQRVALARILAYEPDVILLDEPFSALDLYLKDRLQHELMKLLDDYEGTVIMVSHNRDEIYQFCEELLILDDGMSVIQGKTKEIFKDPGYIEAARLTGCKNIVEALIESSVEADQTIYVPEWGIRLKVDRELEDIHYIGVRAHDFIPIWEEEDGCIKIHEIRLEELPFEHKYYIKPAEDAKEEICWMVQRAQMKEIEEKGMPAYLLVPQDNILLFR